MIELGKRYCFRAEPLDDVRLARQLGAKHLDCDFAFEHHVDPAKDRAHSAFADLVGYFVAANHVANHTRASISRVSRTGFSSASAIGLIAMMPTLILSLPPRSFASAIRVAHAA